MYLHYSIMVLYNAIIDLQKQILGSMIPLTDLNKSIYAPLLIHFCISLYWLM